MPASARLLVNADDFGLHADIDRGILACAERGRVQSVSFSPIGPSIDWRKLRELMSHGIRVGLHVTLVGEPWASDGRFIPGWKDLIRQLLVPGRTMKTAVDAEVRRQFQLCSDNGLDPRTLAHVDSHQHVHVFGGVWQPCLSLVREHGIPRIRVPWCPSLRAIKKSLGGIALQTIARRRGGEAGGFLACLGLAHAGRNTAAIFSEELGYAARRRDIELVVHPGVNTANLESRYPGWRFDWTGERDALLSEQFAQSVEATGYTFVTPEAGSGVIGDGERRIG